MERVLEAPVAGNKALYPIKLVLLRLEFLLIGITAFLDSLIGFGLLLNITL